MYQYKLAVQSSDSNLFYSSPEEHLQNHPNNSQVYTWISMIKPTIQHSIKTVQDLMIKNTNKIYLYFSPSRVYQDSTYKTKKKTNNKQKKISKNQQQAKRKRQYQTFIHMNPSHNMLSYQTYPNLPVTTLTPGEIQLENLWNKANKQIQQNMQHYISKT